MVTPGGRRRSNGVAWTVPFRALDGDGSPRATQTRVKEANTAVSTQQTSQDNPLAGFGPNEWIVEEMYQRYLADPTSVDPAWHDFFADYKPATGRPARHRHAGRRRAAATATAPAATAPQAAAAAAGTGARGVRPPPRPPPPRPAPAADARASGQARAAKAAPATSRPPRPPRRRDAEITPLRGVAARIVQNMDASLEVPTATSVRAVPAKLLVDNRIVINNHLARGRGGKVSFTHLIGYAMVRALVAHPEMNNSFAEVDGKPAMVQPGARQPGHRHRPGQAGRLPHAGGAVHQELRARWTSGSSGRRTRTSSGGPGATS